MCPFSYITINATLPPFDIAIMDNFIICYSRWEPPVFLYYRTQHKILLCNKFSETSCTIYRNSERQKQEKRSHRLQNAQPTIMSLTMNHLWHYTQTTGFGQGIVNKLFREIKISFCSELEALTLQVRLPKLTWLLETY